LYRSELGTFFSRDANFALRFDQRQSSEVLAIEKQQVEEEEHQRSLVGVGRILDQIESRPAIGHHAAQFAIKIGVLRR
jgi:hypothetical protein